MPQTTAKIDTARVVFAKREAERVNKERVDFSKIHQSLKTTDLYWRRVPQIVTIVVLGIFLWGFLMKTFFGEMSLGTNLIMSGVAWIALLAIVSPPLFRALLFPIFIRKLSNIQRKLNTLGGREAICLIIQIDYQKIRMRKISRWFF